MNTPSISPPQFKLYKNTNFLPFTALKQTPAAANEQSLNIERFLKIVRRYSEIAELSGEIFRYFIEKIIVYKAEKIDGVRAQRIRIIYNCIGAIDFSKMDEKRHSRNLRLCRFFQGYKAPM